MKKLITAFIFSSSLLLVSCGSKTPEPEEIALPTVEVFTTHTFVIKWSGDDSMKAKTMKKLTTQKCWTLKDVVPESRVVSTDCHEFTEYKNKSDIHGAYKKIGSSFLVEVKADKKDTFNVKILAKPKKKLKSVMPAAQFVDPDDLAESIRRLSFK